MKITLAFGNCLRFCAYWPTFFLGRRAMLLLCIMTVQAQQQPSVPVTLKPTNGPRAPTTDKKEDNDPLHDRNPFAPPTSPVAPAVVPTAPSNPKPPVGKRAPRPSNKGRGPTKTPLAPTPPPTRVPTTPPTVPPSGLPTTPPTNPPPTRVPTTPPTNPPSTPPTNPPTGSPTKPPTLPPTFQPTAAPTAQCPNNVNCNSMVQLAPDVATQADVSCFATNRPQSLVKDCNGNGSTISFSGVWFFAYAGFCDTSASLTVTTTAGSSVFFPGIFVFFLNCNANGQNCVPLTSGVQGCPSTGCTAASTNTVTWRPTPLTGYAFFVVPSAVTSFGTYSVTYQCT